MERGVEGFAPLLAPFRPSTARKFHSCDDLRDHRTAGCTPAPEVDFLEAECSGSQEARAEGLLARGTFAYPVFQPRSVQAL